MSKIHNRQTNMFNLKVIFVISAIFTFCESASIVSNVKKCELSDDECQQNLYRGILQDISDTGIPEMGIPAVDPYDIKNQEFIVMGMIKMVMTDGQAKGFKTCSSKSFHIDPDTLTSTVAMVCERFEIGGQYKIQTTPLLDALIGTIKIHGEGKGNLVLENVEINFEIPFEYKKQDDCEVHAVIDPDRITYTYKVIGKATIAADSLFIGSQDVSTIAVNIFNENWEFLSNSFARPGIDKGIEIFMEHVNKFFENVPMKDLMLDDLTKYVTN